jgi:hypothetical protein
MTATFFLDSGPSHDGGNYDKYLVVFEVAVLQHFYYELQFVRTHFVQVHDYHGRRYYIRVPLSQRWVLSSKREIINGEI